MGTQHNFSQVVKASHLVLNPPVTKRDFINSMNERKPEARSAMTPTLAGTTFYGKQGTPLMGVWRGRRSRRYSATFKRVTERATCQHNCNQKEEK